MAIYQQKNSILNLNGMKKLDELFKLKQEMTHLKFKDQFFCFQIILERNISRNQRLTFRLTIVYAAEPPRTTTLLTHQSNGLTSLHHETARTVWAAALAVPLILCVKGDVT